MSKNAALPIFIDLVFGTGRASFAGAVIATDYSFNRYDATWADRAIMQGD